MRLFLALEPPAEVRAAVWAGVGSARETAAAGVRWVREEGLHLTLEFLGDVTETAVVALDSACRAVCAACRSFTARLDGAGWFPPGRPARTLWLGLEAGPDLFLLQDGVAAAARAALASPSADATQGAAPRPFHAHLTLARCDPPWPKPRATRFVERLAGVAGLAFPVREVVLMRSHLGRGGSRYERLAGFPLLGGDA